MKTILNLKVLRSKIIFTIHTSKLFTPERHLNYYYYYYYYLIPVFYTYYFSRDSFYQPLNIPSLKMGPTGCSETSVRIYHYTLRNDSEERRSHLLRAGSLKSFQLLFAEWKSRILRTQCHVSLRFWERKLENGRVEWNINVLSVGVASGLVLYWRSEIILFLCP